MVAKSAEKCRVIAVSNQKGGVGKTTTTLNLGVALAKKGKKVLLVDADAQGSLTTSLGYAEPDSIEVNLATILTKIIEDEEIEANEGIIKHNEGIEFMPANIELAGIEMALNNVMSKEMVLNEYIELKRPDYDFIIIDCTPSLGNLTINALTAADSVLIPIQAAYLPVKGLQDLLRTIGKVRKKLNRKLEIEGILITMINNRTNYAKDICRLLSEAYGDDINLFTGGIPESVRAAEAPLAGVSIFFHDPNGKVAYAYEVLAKEVLHK